MRTIIAGLCAATVLLLSTPVATADAAAKPSSCFSGRDFESWKAPDAKTIYIRVRMHDYYRLDLAGSCPALLWPDSHLITKFHGTDMVCSRLDWDLQVGQGMRSIPMPCIVKSMTALTPDEAAAIPKKFKP